MGCAASTQPSGALAPARPAEKAAIPAEQGPPGTVAGDFLPYYSLATLNGREVFGPFLKLQSYSPATGSYQVSALIVCTETVQQRHHNQAEVNWWELLTGQAQPLPTTHAHHKTHIHPHWHVHGAAKGGPTEAAQQLQSAVSRNAPGELIYSWREWRFWRFRFGATCGKAPKHLRYEVSLMPGRSHTIVLPSLNEPWHIAFSSCNGLADTDAETFGRSGGLYALWHDLLRRHGIQPFHVMLCGGDQLYNDDVFSGPLLKGWDQSQDDRDTAAKAAVPFSDAIRAEVEEYYFSHYCAHWSLPAFSEALASIPSINTWDDHDIVDGWGSYPEVINCSAIMTGVFGASSLFYLLFQHHTTIDRLAADGYWCQPSSCSLMQLGATTALLVPDSRTCRTQARVLPPDFLDQARARLRALPHTVRHVLVLAAGPVLYPRLPVQEAMQKLNDLATGDTLVSIIMQKTGLAAQVTKRFGMIEYLDDIIDQWCSTQHIGERDQLLTMLTDLAQERGFRVSLLSGDVHCAGFAMLHSRRGVREADVASMPLPDPKDLARDPRFIPQIISSAILNVPPPSGLLKLLCLTGRNPEPILKDCVQRMVPLFGPEADYNSMLHGRRNWCEVTLGDATGHVTFSWRCEKELGSQEVNTFTIKIPALVSEDS